MRMRRDRVEIRRKARWGVLAGVLAAGGMSMSVWAGVAGMADQGNGLVSEVAAGVAGHENNLVKAAVASPHWRRPLSD